MELTTEEKLVMAHFYNLGCLNKEERARKIVELHVKGYSYAKLSKLWNVPRTTINGWIHPEKRKEWDRKQYLFRAVEKEVQNKTKVGCKPKEYEQEFKKMVWVNAMLKRALIILKEVDNIDNKIGENIFKEIKLEVRRLNQNGH